MHNVKIFNEGEKAMSTHISIDGKPLKCYSVDYHMDADRVPTFTFGIMSLADIDVDNARILFSYTPQTVQEAVIILRHELMNNQDLRMGLLASIESALKELPVSAWSGSAAEQVLGRLVGDDDEYEK